MTAALARFALVAGILAAVLVFGAGPAYRFGLADLEAAFRALRFGVYAAGAAGVLAVLWLVLALGRRSADGAVAFVLALVLAGGAASVPLLMRAAAAKVPFIHDITTDPDDPPAFVALAPVRAAAPNGAEYQASNADEQRRGYPDITPLHSDLPATALFDRALAAARAMGWEIVAAAPADGRIEATDTTFWFGFEDDVVVRVTPEGDGSRLDVRSMSRVGRSDLGKNAARIRAYLAAVGE